ncbi:MAG: hypothetical protein J6A25_13560 [Lachnospiraceae bacterium]|nr:hypothetical protein [Lachnospiraceae bacterium]
MKKTYYKKIIILFLEIIATIIIVFRISYVTKNAHHPQVNIVSQGDGAVYKGVEYIITDAVMWEYNDFYDEYKELDEYYIDDYADECMMLVVEMELTVKDDGSGTFDYYMPIQYYYQDNGVDPFMFADMNPALIDGGFCSGEHIFVPYEIYKVNATEKQWNEIEDMKTTYKIVLGNYPERNELLITDIRRGVAE